MDGKILNSVLERINGRLVSSGRKIYLFMDNAGCHPADVTKKYSNIKVVFLPLNTTSNLQPFDLGIIKHSKHSKQKAVFEVCTDQIKSMLKMFLVS